MKLPKMNAGINLFSFPAGSYAALAEKKINEGVVPFATDTPTNAPVYTVTPDERLDSRDFIEDNCHNLARCNKD